MKSLFLQARKESDIFNQKKKTKKKQKQKQK